jgi:hypothetical protein
LRAIVRSLQSRAEMTSHIIVFAGTDTGFDELLSLRAHDLPGDGVFQAIRSGLSHAELVLIHPVLAGAPQGLGIDLTGFPLGRRTLSGGSAGR